MESLALTNDAYKASRDRVSHIEAKLSLLKDRQKKLAELWEHEISVMTKIKAIKRLTC